MNGIAYQVAAMLTYAWLTSSGFVVVAIFMATMRDEHRRRAHLDRMARHQRAGRRREVY